MILLFKGKKIIKINERMKVKTRESRIRMACTTFINDGPKNPVGVFMERGSRSIIILAVLAAFLASGASALTEDEINRVIINSADWRDVYSGIMYANLGGKSSSFLVSTRHSMLLINQLDNRQKNILVISSKKNPYVVGYKPLLESRNFIVEEQELASANLALARRMADIENYVVIDDAYGYNAISAAPYAMKKKSFVLFADQKNANEIASFLSQRRSQGRLKELIIYGTVDREVKNALSDLDPIIINKGDRFENNVEIVKRYQSIATQGQAVLSNGEFIEASIMSGDEPVLFIGAANVPETIANYIKSSEIKVGILIGNELIGTATSIRRQIGIPVFVKFAQSARAPQGSISAVEDLDRFPMPKYYFDLSVHSVRYNSATNQVEVTYKNNVALGTYVKTTLTLNYGDGERMTVGDNDAVYIDKNGFLTLTYDVDPMDGDITADVFAVYGEGKRALENVLRQTLKVQTVKVFDDSELTIDNVVYDKAKGLFLIDVTNKGKVDTYAAGEIYDIIINDEETVFASDSTIYLISGKKGLLTVPVSLADEDIEANKVIHVKVKYGEREDALVKSVVADFELKFAKGDYLFYILLAVIVILLILLFRKRKRHHGHSV